MLSFHAVWPLLPAFTVTMLVHTSVWFSSVCLVQSRQPVGLVLYTTTKEVHTCKSVGLRMCVNECVFTDTQECCPPGFPVTRQKHSTSWKVCHHAAGWPVLWDDGRTPSHHHQVVCTHWLLLGLFLHVLVFVITQPRDGLKVEITQRANTSSPQRRCLQTARRHLTSRQETKRNREWEYCISKEIKYGFTKGFLVFSLNLTIFPL